MHFFPFFRYHKLVNKDLYAKEDNVAQLCTFVCLYLAKIGMPIFIRTHRKNGMLMGALKAAMTCVHLV